MGKQKSSYKTALDGLHHYLSRYFPISRTEFQHLLPYIEIREYDKKAKVTKEGEVERYFNIIARGLVRKYLPLKNGEQTIQLAVEGHIIHSELSFFYRTPSASVVETIEPTVFLSISYESLEQLYSKQPKFERLGRLIITDLFVRKDHRYFDQLRKNTRERFLDYIKTHSHMLQRVPQKYIASYLNIKPETFSRLKHLMRPRNVRKTGPEEK
ncbi:MAG TPA: Crp/Fnr family transcriptional regulator [Puia sp.]|nr:Crp/Fnr family transcriptional regulator [Puia sp.]